MSKKQRNQSIGKCACPVKGCDQASPVFKFKARGTDDSQRRFAGLLYGQCPTHGRFGADGAAGIQEYILKEIVWPAKSPSTDAAPENQHPNSTSASDVGAKPSPVKAPATVEQSTQPHRPKSRDLWDW